LFLSAIILCASASAEARHRKHYGGHRYLQQNAVKDRTWGGELPASDTSSSQGNSFGPAIAELIRGCSQEAIQLKNWPIDSIALIVDPDAAQQNALDQARNASIETADILAATCPKEIPVALTARFDALKQAVDAFITGLDALRPAMETFYISLNDEQKVRVLAMSANNSLETTGRPQRSSGDGAAHREVSSARQELPCRWLAHALRDWPIRHPSVGFATRSIVRPNSLNLPRSRYPHRLVSNRSFFDPARRNRGEKEAGQCSTAGGWHHSSRS